MIEKLKKELENIVLETMAEWESKNHVKVTQYVFEVLELELITEDLKTP